MKKIMFFGLLITGILISSCKKEKTENEEEGPNPPQFNDNCLLVKKIRDNQNETLYEYDAQKRLVKIIKGNSSRTFSYNGNTITAKITDNNGVFYLTTTITLNSDGLATNVRNDFVAGHWENTAYEYQGTQVMKRIYTHYIATNPSITTYEWENGNLVRVINPSGNVTSTYVYDTSKYFQDADYLGSGFFDSGYRVFKSKHRVKQVITNDTYDITHQENANGRVTGYHVNITPGGDYEVDYEYQCN